LQKAFLESKLLVVKSDSLYSDANKFHKYQTTFLKKYLQTLPFTLTCKVMGFFKLLKDEYEDYGVGIGYTGRFHYRGERK